MYTGGGSGICCVAVERGKWACAWRRGWHPRCQHRHRCVSQRPAQSPHHFAFNETTYFCLTEFFFGLRFMVFFSLPFGLFTSVGFFFGSRILLNTVIFPPRGVVLLRCLIKYLVAFRHFCVVLFNTSWTRTFCCCSQVEKLSIFTRIFFPPSECVGISPFLPSLGGEDPPKQPGLNEPVFGSPPAECDV